MLHRTAFSSSGASSALFCFIQLFWFSITLRIHRRLNVWFREENDGLMNIICLSKRLQELCSFETSGNTLDSSKLMILAICSEKFWSTICDMWRSVEISISHQRLECNCQCTLFDLRSVLLVQWRFIQWLWRDFTPQHMWIILLPPLFPYVELIWMA